MTDKPELGYLAQHTGTGLWRASCNVCGWASTDRTTEAEADIAMVAHLEAVHGEFKLLREEI